MRISVTGTSTRPAKLRRGPPMRRSRGFTLLELLLVVFIIGLITTFAVISVTGRAQDDRLEQEARRLEALLRLAQETAVLQGSEIGFRSDGQTYEFLELDEEVGWRPMPDDTPLRMRELPQDMALEVWVDDFALPSSREEEEDDKGKNDKEKKEPLPDVYFLSSEEVSPFELILTAPGTDLKMRIIATPEGEIRIPAADEALERVRNDS